MGWHNGKWWPLFTPDWFAPKVSQYFFDPYSFTHVLHGVIFQPILSRTIPSFPGSFLSCLGIELCWEILENSEMVMKRYRENSGTSGQYHGDSVQNIVGDITSCALGFLVGTFFEKKGMSWGSLVWILVSEVRKR